MLMHAIHDLSLTNNLDSVIEPSGDRADQPDRTQDNVSIQSVESQMPDDEPTLSASGRKLYSREFLLRFQVAESSFVRPDGLALNEDYVAKKVRTRSVAHSRIVFETLCIACV